MSRRTWTNEDQVVAIVMRWFGCSWASIGKSLGKKGDTVKYNLEPQFRQFIKGESRNKYEDIKDDPAFRAKRNEYGRAYRQNNLDKCRERHRKYALNAYHKDPQKHKERHKEWRSQKLRGCQEYAQREKVLNRERNRAYRERNRESIRQRHREWCAANLARVRSISRHNQHLRRSRQRRALVAFSLQQLTARWALFQNRCAYCGKAGMLTEDHVIPLSVNGVHELGNLLPACLPHNCSKFNRPVEAWYKRQPFFSPTRWKKILKHCPAAAREQLSLHLPDDRNRTAAPPAP